MNSHHDHNLLPEPKRRGTHLVGLITATFLMLTMTPALRATVIDAFDFRPNFMPLTSSNTRLFPVENNRGMYLSSIPSPTESITVDIQNTTAPFFLSYTSTTRISGFLGLGYGTVTVPAYFTLPQVGGPFPLFLSPNPATDVIRLTFLSYNHANAQDMEIDTSLDTGISPDNVSVSISTFLTAPGPQTLDIPLTALPTNATLNAFSFNFDAPPGTAFQLQSVEFLTPTPEPASLPFAGTLLAVLAIRIPHRRHT